MTLKPEKKIISPANPVYIAPFNPLGEHESRILAAAAVYTPGDQPKGAIFLLVQALTENVRFTIDGTAPMATTGFQLVAGDPAVIIPLGSNSDPSFIAETAGAVLEYQWGE